MTALRHRRECPCGPKVASGGFYPRIPAFAAAAHVFEQYFTRSQSRSHFFLQANSRLQYAQGLVGRW